MQLNDAVNLVKDKFMAEARGETDGPAAEKYHDAFEQFPVMMEVATQVFGVQIIQQNIAQQMQRQQGGGGEAGGGVGGAGPITGGGTQPPPA
jgi:hypothetical protein